MCHALRSGKLHEDNEENADEIFFLMNMDNRRTIGFKRGEEFKSGDVVSEGEGRTMVVRFSGGRDTSIKNCFMVFKNQDRRYPIRCVPDTIEGVAY